MKIKVKVKKINKKAIISEYATKYSAGVDLRACIDEKIIIKPNETKKITTGLAMEIPENVVGLIYARSGLATKKNISPANKVGVVDSDYRGEIAVFLTNEGENDFVVENNDRIAQMVFTPYYTAEFIETDELEETERGTGGFGSTGLN